MLESLTNQSIINVLLKILLSDNALLGPTELCVCLTKLEKEYHQNRMNYTQNGQIK